MEVTTALYGLAAIFIVIGLYLRSIKKADTGNFSAIIGVILAVVVFAGASGVFLPLTVSDEPTTGVTLIEGVIDGTCVVKSYTQINFSGDTWGADDPTAPAGSVDFYIDGVNPSDSGANRLTTLSVTAGVGGLTNSVLQSCVPYGIVYNGASAEYDMWYNGVDWTQDNFIPYTQTSDSVIGLQVMTFNDILVVGTLPDPIEEDSTTGEINGQTTSVSGNVSDGQTLEVRVGTDATPADSDVIYYNKTNGDLSWYVDINIGTSGANKVIVDPVLCFYDGVTNEMENDEFDSVTLEHQSGTDWNIQTTDITEDVNGLNCISLGDRFDNSRSGVYRLTFNGINANLGVGTDIFYATIDDMGDRNGKDILKNSKATQAAVMEFQFQT